ncbi:MAG: tRNA 2-selenouridine synthase [Gammaproteobacteria bacterium]
MKSNNSVTDYRAIFLEGEPLMDVRAPVEFNRGAFPSSVNIPLLDNDQREIIGIEYKNAGEQAAILLGQKMATPEIRQQRLVDWVAHCRANPSGYLYCFRGGLRSRITQSWIAESGVNYPIIGGGYKAMRRFLIDELEQCVSKHEFIMVSGNTGSGKTDLLNQLPLFVDLEGLANHRGSAFGSNVNDLQPSQITFENTLAIDFLKLDRKSTASPVFLEDEGRRIGRLCLPTSLCAKMRDAPRAILEEPLSTRVELIRRDYISSAWPLYQHEYGNDAEVRFSEFVLNNLSKIRKRLGDDRYKRVASIFGYALKQLFIEGKADAFDEGIAILLVDYYDPMYQFQLKQKDSNILFRGNANEYLVWADEFKNEEGLAGLKR